jgi:para-nitrobenzyl esterase
MKQLFIITTFWLLASCDQTENSLPATEGQPAMNEIIQTNYGQLRGVMADNTASVIFKGIPYAKPPVGELRWRPPESPATWSGIRDANQFSQSCIQPTNTSSFVWTRGDFDVSEDCLYLNIWSDTEVKKQPVMVWFHGGAHTSGQGHSEIFNGTRLSQQGVVLVSINYRLGAFGFLAHPWLSQESEHASSGNYGLLDKIAALNWVKDNIEQFGGDAENVTIFGQSAGSQSICSLMASPLAKGLFHKAIGQSAACVGPAPKHDINGQQRGEKLANELKATNLSELRASSPEPPKHPGGEMRVVLSLMAGCYLSRK